MKRRKLVVERADAPVSPLARLGSASRPPSGAAPAEPPARREIRSVRRIDQTANRMEAAMQPVPGPRRPPRTGRRQRLRVTRRQHGRRSTLPIDRRTPSGRLLAY